jgi:inorganic pyrophosphatase/exopolyphosphatase
LPFLIIAVVFYSIYLYKISKAKQLLSEAEEAEKDGNLASAVILLKQALWKANEKPEMEKRILLSLTDIFGKYQITLDTGDYEKLIEQFQILKKKSSRKSLQEMGKVNKLKKELITKMPDLP